MITEDGRAGVDATLPEVRDRPISIGEAMNHLSGEAAQQHRPGIGGSTSNAHRIEALAFKHWARRSLAGDRPRCLEIEFDALLREICAEVAAQEATTTPAVTITCKLDALTLPSAPAIRMGIIAAELLRNAFRNAFPDKRGGRIGVSFVVDPTAWVLTIEDSGIAMRPYAARGAARTITRHLRGKMESPKVLGGSRYIVMIPRTSPLSQRTRELPGPIVMK